MRRKIAILGLLVVFIIVAVTVVLSSKVSNPSWTFKTMGTTGKVTISGSIPKSMLEEIQTKMQSELAMVNGVMSTFSSDTQISKFNASHSTEPFEVSEELAEVTKRALWFSQHTSGAFDPTVKPLVDYWGFGAKANEEDLKEIMKSVGWQKVSVKSNALIKKNENTQIVLSAIAKGYGVDRVANALSDLGFDNFLVEIGGEIVVKGVNKGKAWQIGIEDPREDVDVFQTFGASDIAMATSGDYRNFRVRDDGTVFSHIIDPITGKPAESDVASVSVLAPNCMDADALATALCVIGSKKGMALVENWDDYEALFILHSTNDTFTSISSSGFNSNK